MAPTDRKALFKDVVFYDSASALTEKHRRILTSGGAIEETSEGDIDWSNLTHVFTLDLDFPGKQDATQNTNLAVVTVYPIQYYIHVATVDRNLCYEECPAKSS